MRVVPDETGRNGRPGYTLLEVLVAFVLLGIGLAGLCPLIVIQLKLSRLVARSNPRADEDGVPTATTYLWPDKTFYLVPPAVPDDANGQATPWFQKLGAAAVLVDAAPTPPAVATQASTNVTILAAPQRTIGVDGVTVRIGIKP